MSLFCVVMLNVTKLNVIMLCVVMLNVVMLSVMAPLRFLLTFNRSLEGEH
jgi:hypothetical protein